jgi:hypothetical protein
MWSLLLGNLGIDCQVGNSKNAEGDPTAALREEGTP